MGFHQIVAAIQQLIKHQNNLKIGCSEFNLTKQHTFSIILT